MNSSSRLIKNFSLLSLSFSFGFFFYLLVETVYKHFFSESPTHWSMGLVSGLAFLFLLWLDKFSLHLLLKALLGGAFISFFELLAGLFFNLHLKMRIWDYHELPLNFHGQICLSFSLVWCVAALGILWCNRKLLRLFAYLYPEQAEIKHLYD